MYVQYLYQFNLQHLHFFIQQFLEISLICTYFAAKCIVFTFCICFKPKHLSKNNPFVFQIMKLTLNSLSESLSLSNITMPISHKPSTFLSTVFGNQYLSRFLSTVLEISIYLSTILLMHFFLLDKKLCNILALLFSVLNSC